MGLFDMLGDFDAKDIGKIVTFVKEHGDLLEKVKDLPELFDKFGDGIHEAGAQASAAGRALVGDGVKTGAKHALGEAAELLGDVTTTIGAGIEKIEAVARQLTDIPMVGSHIKPLAGAVTEVGEATSKLKALAGSMDDLADLLAKVGEGLGKLGDHLSDSGAQAKRFLAT